MSPLEDDLRDVQALLRGRRDTTEEERLSKLKQIAWRWNLIYENACSYGSGRVFSIIDTSKKGNKHLRIGERSNSITNLN